MIVALLNQRAVSARPLVASRRQIGLQGESGRLLAALMLPRCNGRRSTDWRWPRCWRFSKPAVGALGTVDQSAFVVRPTTDMTPQLRDRVAAFQHHVTVADTLRARLAHEFPTASGEPK
ncbi:hypothetical protein NKJ46_10990 [Mesorhizobium sp. M0166]|uniref:hypothetical protein n=1 Tax=Mesorhizobium sp. M0166 TaxID=2956902 RepID=UPI00333B1F06